MLVHKLPGWSQPILKQLMAQKPVSGLEPHPIRAHEKQQLGATAWVVDTYIGYDENAAIDSALGESGRVLVQQTELHFESDQQGSTEAALLGQDKENRPVALVYKKDETGVEAYSIQNLGEHLYVQGGRLSSDGSGFYMAKGILA